MFLLAKKNGIVKNTTINPDAEIIKGCKTHTLFGGEFAITHDSENIAFKTLLGSCVAIMFYDNVKHIKAMNHFLLPKTSSANNDLKYGLFSVETMLNEMYKLGSKKENIVAKISGGASMIDISLSSTSIGNKNVNFAIDFCKIENIKIISNHTRGIRSRIILLTNNFETFIKNIEENIKNIDIVNSEIKLQQELFTNEEIDYNNKIVIF